MYKSDSWLDLWFIFSKKPVEINMKLDADGQLYACAGVCVRIMLKIRWNMPTFSIIPAPQHIYS